VKKIKVARTVSMVPQSGWWLFRFGLKMSDAARPICMSSSFPPIWKLAKASCMPSAIV